MGLRIAAFSDIHGTLLPLDSFEECEVAFICGDISPLNKQANDRKMKKWLKEVFKPWAESIPCKKVFFIAGNHDYCLYRDPNFMMENFSKEDKVEYICDNKVEYTSEDGKTYTIYGTPWCKQFGNWPFMAGLEELEQLYQGIPYNLGYSTDT